MESRYGIGINNRYALFLSEDGEIDSTMPSIVPKKGSASEEPAEKKPIRKQTSASVSQSTDSKSGNKEDKENRNINAIESSKRPQPVQVREGGNLAREERNNRKNEVPNENGMERGSSSGVIKDEGRGGNRGYRGSSGGVRNVRGNEGSGRGNRGGFSRGGGKREFERKSGDDRTGVKSVDKRDGSGSYNWGTTADEIIGINEEANTSAEEGGTQIEGGTSGSKLSGDEGVVMESGKPGVDEEEEQVERTMTLDEWKQTLQAAKKAGPVFNVRKAGEGSEIDPKWKKTYAYKKEKELNEDDDEEEHTFYPQRVNRQKRVMDIKFNFSDSGSGGRGGSRVRGGGRGPRGFENSRGRGGGNESAMNDESGRFVEDRERRNFSRRSGDRPFKSGRNAKGGKNEAPNVNDELSFPSLG